MLRRQQDFSVGVDKIRNLPSGGGCHLLLQNHHRLRARVVGRQTLDQFRVMEAVHEFDLVPSRCPIFGGPCSVELPRAHLTRLFMRQSEHFTKLPAGKKENIAALLLTSLAA